MKSIKTVDPFVPLYEFEKMRDPSFDYVMKPVKRADIEAVDYLNKIAGGQHSTVETVSDWGIVAKILEFWCRRWPSEWQEFAKSMSEIRATRARKDGYSREQGRHGVRYLGAIPLRLMRLIKVIFPDQQWNREFTDKFTNNIKITKVGEKMDTWFHIPEAPSFKRDIVKEAVENLKS